MKVLTLKSPNIPIKVIIGNTQRNGYFIKLWKGSGSIICQINNEAITKASKTKFSLKTTFFSFEFKSEFVLKIIPMEMQLLEIVGLLTI